MGIKNIWSKRNKIKVQPNGYKCDIIPSELKVQIVHILHDTIGPYQYSNSAMNYGPFLQNQCWDLIHKTLCKEYSKFKLCDNGDDTYEITVNFFLQENNVDRVLDVIELCFQVINEPIRNSIYDGNSDKIQDPDDAIIELNTRFEEHNVGYRFVNNEIIRMNSEFLYKEAIEPAIYLLQNNKFTGALDEFMKAHKYYRNGKSKEAISEALKSFESTMKAICSERKWKLPENATAKSLIDTCYQHGLVPQYIQSNFASLRATLESGLPTIRNKSTSAHGQGKDIVEIPGYLAAYAIHLAGASIVFLIQANESNKK